MCASDAQGASVQVILNVQRREHAHDTTNQNAEVLPRAGAVLRVIRTDGNRNAANELREQLVHALRRGSRKRPRAAPMCGEGDGLEHAIAKLKAKGTTTDRLTTGARLAVFALLGAALVHVKILPSGTGAAVSVHSAELTSIRSAMFVGAIAGGIITVIGRKWPQLNPLLILWSPIEIADRTILDPRSTRR